MALTRLRLTQELTVARALVFFPDTMPLTLGVGQYRNLFNGVRIEVVREATLKLPLMSIMEPFKQ